MSDFENRPEDHGYPTGDDCEWINRPRTAPAMYVPERRRRFDLTVRGWVTIGAAALLAAGGTVLAVSSGGAPHRETPPAASAKPFSRPTAASSSPAEVLPIASATPASETLSQQMRVASLALYNAEGKSGEPSFSADGGAIRGLSDPAVRRVADRGLSDLMGENNIGHKLHLPVISSLPEASLSAIPDSSVRRQVVAAEHHGREAEYEAVTRLGYDGTQIWAAFNSGHMPAPAILSK